MLAPVKNYDLICYQLRNNLYSQLDNPLKKEINKLSKEITKIIESNKKNHILSIDILSQLFNLRVKAIKWLSQDKNFNYLEKLTEVSIQIEEIGENKKMQILKDNILFALRCNRRVIESLFNSGDESINSISDFNLLPDINYHQFLSSLAFAVPDNETAQKIIEWTNASLNIEFVMLAADIINDGNIKVSDKSINDLSFLIADAAQQYFALATEFGLLKSKSNQHTFSKLSFDEKFIINQKTLAEIGFENFKSNFTN